MLFANLLFFAGISTRVHALRHCEVRLGFGWLIFLGTTIWLVTLPTTLSI